MKSIIDRLRTLGIRVHAIYLSVNEYEEQKDLIRLEDLLLFARHCLAEGSLDCYNESIKLVVKYALEQSVRLRRLYGNSIRGKLKRISEAAKELILTQKQFKELKPIQQIRRRTYTYFDYFYQDFKFACQMMANCRPDLDGIPVEETRDQVRSILQDIAEYRLLLGDRWADGLVNQHWSLTKDIIVSINSIISEIYKLLDLLPDCAYKCRVYRALQVLDLFNAEISNYYIA